VPRRNGACGLRASAARWIYFDTDHIFNELLRDRPVWLREPTGLPLPPGCRARSLSMKQMEIRRDLVLKPEDTNEAPVIVESQLYYDHAIFNHGAFHGCLPQDCSRSQPPPKTLDAVFIKKIPTASR
jgi:hypothetical protein